MATVFCNPDKSHVMLAALSAFKNFDVLLSFYGIGDKFNN